LTFVRELPIIRNTAGGRSNETQEYYVMSASNSEEGVIEALEEIIEELVDIEECVLAGRPVPRARRYRYRVNKTHYVSDTPELTREQILERAELVPVDQYRLSEKRRHGPPVEIKPEQVVHLHKGEIERFIAQHCEVQDGLNADRREFQLPAEDVAFLNDLGLRCETVSQGGMWVIIYGVTLPAGYLTATVDIAIQILPGYPTSPLDMAYFYPAIARADGRPIPNSEAVQPLDGKGWQRWSRHRLGASIWVPGVDNLERHFVFIQQWLAREITR
jgi:hypothetical protein